MIPSADWVPATLRLNGATPMVQWCHLGGHRFTQSFYEQTVWRAMTHPFNLLFNQVTPLDALEDARSDLRLAGFIFHISHCGSTLVSRMLATLERNVVLSEPAPLSRVIKLRNQLVGLPEDQLVRWMRGMVAALARKRHVAERDVFIKLDGWHVLLLPLFRRAFPDVPWMFLYRDPLEVLVALELARPGHTLPGAIDAALLGSEPARTAAMSFEDHSALVLDRYFRAAIAHYRDGGLLVEYRELSNAACGKVLDHFGLRYGEAEIVAMRAAANADAKRPDKPFRPDGEKKRQNATAELRQLAEGLAPLYAQLEALRRAQ